MVLDGDSTLVYALEASPLLTLELTAAWGKASPADDGHPAERDARGPGADAAHADPAATTMYAATMHVASPSQPAIVTAQALSGRLVAG